LRRVDYAIESSVGTRERSSFATGYRDFLGIKVATKHEIFAKNRDGSINRDTSGEFLIRAIQFA
jgi:hypothetical protein